MCGSCEIRHGRKRVDDAGERARPRRRRSPPAPAPRPRAPTRTSRAGGGRCRSTSVEAPGGEQREAEERRPEQVLREREHVPRRDRRCCARRGAADREASGAKSQWRIHAFSFASQRSGSAVAETRAACGQVDQDRAAPRKKSAARTASRPPRRAGAPALNAACARALLAIVMACWSRCMLRCRFCVASTSPAGGDVAADLAQELVGLEAERLEVAGP